MNLRARSPVGLPTRGGRSRDRDRRHVKERLRRANVGPLIGVPNDQIHGGVSLDPCPGERILGDDDAIDRRRGDGNASTDGQRRRSPSTRADSCPAYDELSARSRLMTTRNRNTRWGDLGVHASGKAIDNNIGGCISSFSLLDCSTHRPSEAAVRRRPTRES